MSNLWESLLKNLDPALRQQLSLDRVLVSRDGTKLEVRLHAARLLEPKEYRAIRKALAAGFPDARLSVRVGYPSLKDDVLQDVDKYSKFVGALISDEKPGAMPYLFWEDAKWRLSQDKQRLHIAVSGKMGADFLTREGVDKRIEQLLRELFQIDVQALIDVIGDEEQQMQRIAERRREEEALLAQAHIEQEKAMAAKRASAGLNGTPLQEGGNGALIGKPFSDPTIPIGELTDDAGKVCLVGEVAACEFRDLRNGNSKLVSFSLTDPSGACACKAFIGGKRDSAEAAAKLLAIAQDGIRNGAWVKLRGDYQYDSFKREMVVMVRDCVRAEKPTRKDTAPRKRVELHLHTNMSAMDAIASPTDMIKQAAKWGHPAIAITDHGVVQAFPEAFGAAKKNKIKLIPGCEGYLIDDTLRLVQRPSDVTLDEAAYVVLDVETTGLNNAMDEIIEIGAVRIENGVEVGEFSQLINPLKPLGAKITEITGITDAMLFSMPTIKQIMPSFIEFCQGAVLVAHNAEFDMGFISRGFAAAGARCDAPVIDTLAASRACYVDLKSHKLGALCKRLDISLKNAHRAVHDARATSLLLLNLIGEWKKRGAKDLPDLNTLYDGGAGGGSGRHIILLARNQTGMRNLYYLVSEAHLHHFKRTPRIPRALLAKHREGLIVGSACEAGELFRAALDGASDDELMGIARFYDYLEIQPQGNNEFLVREGRVPDFEALQQINRRILDIGDSLGKPVVATGDVHFMEPHDAIFRSILMNAKGFESADDQPPLYFKTTDEMLSEFAYLGAEDAERVVIDAPNQIAEMVGEVKVFLDEKETYQPEWDFAPDDIKRLSIGKSVEIYGDPLPEVVQARLDKELKSIIGNGFSTLFDIAVKLVSKSLSDGYIVGSRGSVGSSYVAWATGITEVNALPPHYVCPSCKHSEFVVPKEYTCGLDLPDKSCPVCGALMDRDGYNIPFEVFLGFEGDKVPDIDLNFSGEYQPVAHAYVKDLFGTENVFRAGTIGTVAEKTAFGYVKKYLEERGMTATGAEMERLARGCTGVKRTTGQHPAGMVVLPKDYEIYQFTAIQHPADDLSSDTITTHFDFGSMHDVLVKLDILGHDDPTMLKKLQDLTGIAPQDVPLNDKKAYGDILSLFQSPDVLGVTAEQIGVPTGTLGIPEFGTRFVRQMLMDTKPSSMEELIRISGLSHGTDVWLGNTQDIIKAGIAPLRQCICTRDDIMNQLIDLGVESKMAFTIMESVRKGKGLKPDMEQAMIDAGTPEWFIGSCKKIKYMFPKAHAVAYVTMALRIAYFKVYYPGAYYACFLLRNADAFDGSRMIAPVETLRDRLREIAEADKDQKTAKDEDEAALLENLIEMKARGIELLPVSLYDSDPEIFILMEDKKRILPPLSSLPGLGVAAAKVLADARKAGPFISQEDMIRRKVAKSVVDILKTNGALGGLPETSQMSLFDFA